MDNILERTAVFTQVACRKYTSYAPRIAAQLDNTIRYFAVNGRFAVDLEHGVSLLKDLEARLGATSEPLERTTLVALHQCSLFTTEMERLITEKRDFYNTAEKHENEVLAKHKCGLFKLRRYASWDYPFVVGLPQRFNGGKRGRRFFGNVDEAARFIDEQLLQARRIGEKVLSLPEADRLMVLRAKDKLEPYGKTIDDAIEFYVRMLKDASTSITLKDLSEEWYVARQKDGFSERHLDTVKSQSKLFQQEVGNLPASQVTSVLIDDYLRGLDKAPLTRNHAKSALTSLFAYAVARGYMQSNPAKIAMKAKVVKSGPPGILRVDELRKLLTVVTDEFAPFLYIGAWAGLRRSEIERLTWAHILWDRNLIEVEPENTKKSNHRFVKMLPCLVEKLKPFKGAEGLICDYDTSNQVEKLCKDAGLVAWPHNALRHSYASHHLAHFRDAEDLAMELGHATTETLYKNYRHAVTPEEGKEWFIS